MAALNCTPASLPIKRSEGRRLVQARRIRQDAREKQFWLSGRPQEMDRSSTGFQHARPCLFRRQTGRPRRWARSLSTSCLPRARGHRASCSRCQPQPPRSIRSSSCNETSPCLQSWRPRDSASGSFSDVHPGAARRTRRCRPRAAAQRGGRIGPRRRCRISPRARAPVIQFLGLGGDEPSAWLRTSACTRCLLRWG
jgi:hypothetical protein